MAFTLASGVITQTGTDANPSGLGAIAGVTTINDASGQVLTYDLNSLRLVVNGTLTIPDRYWIKSQGTTSLNVLTVGATGKLVIDGRKTLTRPEGVITIYSLACGIIIRRPSGVPFTVRTIQFDSGSQFEQYGGIVESSGAIRWLASTTSLATFKEATWYVFDRNNNGYMNLYIPLTKVNVDGWRLFSNDAVNPGFLSTLDAGYSIKGYECKGGLVSIGAIDGTTALVRLDGFVGGFSRFDFGVRQGGIVTNEGPVGGYDFYNANIGNGLIAATNATANQTTGRARHFVSFTPTFLDAGTSDGIVGMVLYQKDSNSGNRRVNNGVPGDKVYITTSGAGGVYSQIDLLTKVWSGTGVNPMFQDDRLPINGYAWGYGHLGTPVNITSSIGPQSPTLYAPADTSVTLDAAAAAAKLASSFTVVGTTVTVTANSTYDDLYDALKAYKCSAVQAQLETPVIGQTIVTAGGSSLTAYTGWTLAVNTGVTLAAGTKFDFIEFDTITLTGTGKITGLYGTSAGRSTNYELRDIKPGAAYIVANNATKATILYGVNNEATAQTYTVQFPPGSAGTAIYAARKTIGDFFDFEVVTLQEGLVWTVFTDIPDEGAKETNEATLNAYTALETNTKVYNYVTGIYQRTEEGIKLGNFFFREGKLLKWVSPYSAVVDQSAGSLFSKSSNLFTIKANGLAADENYDTNVMLGSTATLTANTNEVLGTNIEDADGNSSLEILGGDGAFELWKVTTATATADYATGTKLADVTNEKYRFIGVTGFDIVGVDTLSNIRRRTSMAKGIYSQSFYVGEQIQLAQAPQVNQINSKVDLLQVAVDALPTTIWDKVIESGHSALKLMRLMSSVLLGKVSGAGTATETFRDINDTKDRVIADVDNKGNRTNITRDPD